MFQLASFRGIRVYIHPTFWLLILWVGLSDFVRSRSLQTALGGVFFVFVLFACVVLHEFGHALTAQRYGIQTQDITLYPIGGVARLERIPEQPLQELWIALAGPAVNGLIALLLWLFLRLPLSQLSYPSFWSRLLSVNLLLAGFNLIPAFPMDGGRVLRALLALKLDYLQATSIAAQLAKAFAFLFGAIGLFSNPFLVFIAFFVWEGAEQETSMTRQRLSLSGLLVSQAMLTRYEVLRPDNTLKEAAQLLLASSQADFPVVENGRLVGMLTREALIQGLRQLGDDALVRESMIPNPTELQPHQRLDEAFVLLQQSDLRTLPVTDQGELIGLLTLENIGEFLLIRAAHQAA